MKKWKVASRKSRKIGNFHDFRVTNSTKFSPWRWKLSKKSRSHDSESTFYQFYSHKTKIYKKFWKSEKLLDKKVEKSEIFMILSHEKVPIFDFRHGNFWENNVSTSQKTLFFNPNQLKKIRKKISKSRDESFLKKSSSHVSESTFYQF